MPHEWKRRLEDTGVIVLADDPGEVNAGFFVGTQPVGLLTLSRHDGYFEVDTIVTHPGTQGAGGALIEHAVNVAHEDRCGGALRLTPMQSSVPAYEALGFRSVADEMRLDPQARPDIWCRHETQWRLRKHLGKPYVVALLESAPPQAQATGSGGNPERRWGQRRAGSSSPLF